MVIAQHGFCEVRTCRYPRKINIERCGQDLREQINLKSSNDRTATAVASRQSHPVALSGDASAPPANPWTLLLLLLIFPLLLLTMATHLVLAVTPASVSPARIPPLMRMAAISAMRSKTSPGISRILKQSAVAMHFGSGIGYGG